jgi:hypothetical protein
LKLVRFPNRFVSFTIAGAVALAVAFEPGHERVLAQAPPPPPVPSGSPAEPPSTAGTAPPATPLPTTAPSVEASPAALPSPEGRRRHRREPGPAASPEPSPSATPTSPAFSTLDGTWETQVQYIDHTDYSYLVIKQNATGELSGVWRVSGKQYPFDGSYDGRLILLHVKEPSVTLNFSGYVEGASDMVGTIDFAQGKGDPTPFTAEHRAAAKNPFKREPPEKKS